MVKKVLIVKTLKQLIMWSINNVCSFTVYHWLFVVAVLLTGILVGSRQDVINALLKMC